MNRIIKTNDIKSNCLLVNSTEHCDCIEHIEYTGHTGYTGDTGHTRHNESINLVENNYHDKIINYLEDIYDLDKIIRKLEINTINPYELYQLYISFYQIIKLTEYLKEQKLLQVFNISEKKIVMIKKKFLPKTDNRL
jgi:hypothetical protein